MSEHDKPWRAARYLMRGRPTWNTAWIDTIQWRDPRAYLEQRLGELEEFEWIDGVPAMSMRQALNGEILRVRLPEKRRETHRGGGVWDEGEIRPTCGHAR